MIQMNDFQRQWDFCRSSVLRATEEVGRSGWYVLGDRVSKFEHALAGTLKRQHCVGVASGLDALEIALRASGCKEGTKVLTTPLSAFATTLALIRIGARPIFADVDDYGLLDLELVAKALSIIPEIEFVLPVHLYGNALHLNKLRELSRRFGVRVIEDCAQAVGASSHGESVGSVGVASALSFYPTKNLGAFGDGGALVTDDGNMDALARTLRDYGQSRKYEHTHIGMNSRLDELHAAILDEALLPNLGMWTGRRKEVARLYREGIQNRSVDIPSIPPGSDSVCHLFPVLVRAGHRSGFQEHLKIHGVASAVHYPVLIPDQKAMHTYKQFDVFGTLSVAMRFAECEVSLPIHPFLTKEEVDQVIEACNSWSGN